MPTTGISRRQLLKTLGIGGCALVATSLSGCTIAEVFGANGDGFDFNLDEARFKPLQIVDGVVALDTGGRNVLLIRSAEDTIVALNRICTHTACDMAPDRAGRWDGEKLICLCHNSQFAPDGTVLQGPATRDLPSYPVQFNASSGEVEISFENTPVEVDETIPVEYRDLSNPFVDDPEALSAGETIYQDCAFCHGNDGTGNPVGYDPPASEFAVDQSKWSDGYMFWRVRTGPEGGLEDTAMPAYRSLSDDDIWRVVTYVRSLAL